MANIERPFKTFGTRTYVGEVAAAPGNEAPILSAEVDADFAAIYDAWNQQGANYKPGSIGAGVLGPDSVGLINMQDNSVDSSNIVDRSITHLDIGMGEVWEENLKNGSVSTRTIVPGATVRFKQQVDATPGSLPNDKNVNIVLTTTTFTVTGTFLEIWVSLMIQMAPYVTGGHGIGLFHIRTFQGAGPDVIKHGILVAPPGNETVLFTVPLMAIADGLTAGANTTVRVSAQQAQAGGVVPGWDLVAGRLIVVEPS